MIRLRTFAIVLLVGVLVPLLAVDIITAVRGFEVRRRIILEHDEETAVTLRIAFNSFISRIVQTEEVAGLAIALDEIDSETAVQFLQEVRRRSPRVSTLAYANTDGSIIFSDPKRTSRVPKAAVDQILEDKEFVVLPLRPQKGNRAAFEVIVGIRTEGKIRAIVSATVSDRAVFELISKRVSGSRNLSITDNRGRAVALSFKPDLTWLQRDRRSISSVRKALRGQPSIIDRFSDPLDDVDRFGASVPIEPIGWVASVFEPVGPTLGVARREFLGLTLFSVLVSAGVLAFIIVFGRQLTGSIESVATEIEPIRAGDFKHRLHADYQIREINQLADTLNITAQETERRFEIERNIAATLQAGLAQLEPPSFPGYEVGTKYHSATEQALVGGDFFDFIMLDEGEIGILIGDVQGKGIESALATLKAREVFHSLAAHREPSAVLAELNSKIAFPVDYMQMITCIYLVIDIQAGHVRYASAGHPPPMICGSGSCRFLETHDIALGVIEDVDYRTGQDHLQPGEVLLLYTDGLIEIRSNKEFFGNDRLPQAVLQNIDANAQALCDKVFSLGFGFGRGKLSDDVAVIAIRRVS